MNKILTWLDSLLMSRNQREWMSKLRDARQWQRDTSSSYPDAIHDSEGNHTFLVPNAVFIYNKHFKRVCIFWPDWFGTRARVCEKLNRLLGER